eukprot:jgi/Chlat1/5155/Chrsp33S05145
MTMGAPASVAGWRAQLRDNIAHARRNLRLVLEDDGGPGGSSSCRREHQQLLLQQQVFSPSRRPWRYDAYNTTVSTWRASDLMSSPSSSLQEEQLAKLVAGLEDKGRNQGSPLEADRIQRVIADEMMSVKSELSSVRSELRNLASGQAQAASSASESLQLRESINQLERDVAFMRTTTEQTFASLSAELKQLQSFAMAAIQKLAAEAAEALKDAQMFKSQAATSRADRELLAKKSAECQRLRAQLDERLAQEAQSRDEAEQLAAECHQLRAKLSFITMERSADRKSLELKAAALEQLRADVHQSTADQQALSADADEVDRLREALEHAVKDRDKSAEALKVHIRNTDEQELRAALDEACANGHMVNVRVHEMERELQLLRTAAAQRAEQEQKTEPVPSEAAQKLEKNIASLQTWFADIQKQLQDLQAAQDQKPLAAELAALATKIQQLAETESGIAAKLQLQQDFLASQATLSKPAPKVPMPAVPVPVPVAVPVPDPVVPEVAAELPKTLRKKPAALAIPTSKAQIGGGATSLEHVRLRSTAGLAGAAASGHNSKHEIPLPKRKVVSPPLTDSEGRVLHILSNGKELYLEPVSVRAHFFEELAHTGSDESAPSSPKKMPSPPSWWKSSGFTSPQVSAVCP